MWLGKPDTRLICGHDWSSGGIKEDGTCVSCGKVEEGRSDAVDIEVEDDTVRLNDASVPLGPRSW